MDFNESWRNWTQCSAAVCVVFREADLLASSEVVELVLAFVRPSLGGDSKDIARGLRNSLSFGHTTQPETVVAAKRSECKALELQLRVSEFGIVLLTSDVVFCDIGQKSFAGCRSCLRL